MLISRKHAETYSVMLRAFVPNPPAFSSWQVHSRPHGVLYDGDLPQSSMKFLVRSVAECCKDSCQSGNSTGPLPLEYLMVSLLGSRACELHDLHILAYTCMTCIVTCYFMLLHVTAVLLQPHTLDTHHLRGLRSVCTLSAYLMPLPGLRLRETQRRSEESAELGSSP